MATVVLPQRQEIFSIGIVVFASLVWLGLCSVSLDLSVRVFLAGFQSKKKSQWSNWINTRHIQVAVRSRSTQPNSSNPKKIYYACRTLDGGTSYGTNRRHCPLQNPSEFRGIISLEVRLVRRAKLMNRMNERALIKRTSNRKPAFLSGPQNLKTLRK